MFKRIANYVLLAVAYIQLNLKAHLEYRGAFLSQMVAMIVNDCVWVSFWILFFDRFPVIHGWGAVDVITLWAISASGFGIAESIFGNSAQLAALIAQGELDAWLLYPRALLSHLILGKMNATAIGDAIFGYAIYVMFVHPDFAHFLLFAVLTFSVAITFVGVNILAGSLGFFLGNAQVLADQWRFALATFSVYPPSLFDGPIKFVLYTLIPAAFVSYLPIEALHQFSLPIVAISMLGSSAVVVVAGTVFYLGLRRYESGNLMSMKG